MFSNPAPYLPYPVSEMSKRGLLFLVLYLSCLGAIAFGIDFRIGVTPLEGYTSSQTTLQVSLLGIGDFLPDEARVARGIVTALPRQRVGDLPSNPENWGLEFLACRIIRSYSEIHLEDYAIQLMGKTIQVNAP